MKIHLSRFLCLDPQANLRRLEEECDQACAERAELCVFPESFLHGYRRILEPERARAAFSAISASHPQTAFVFGSFTEARRNRMTFWRGGAQLARYDKVHLFAPNDEFELWEPGDQYVAVRFGDWVLGLLNCNDLRFPEQARMLRTQARCDALVVVAWWPWRRDHVWRTLLQARAIENGIFTIGCCIAGSQHPGEDFAGAGNYVFDPIGEPVPTADDHSYSLDRDRFKKVLIDPLKTYVKIERIETF